MAKKLEEAQIQERLGRLPGWTRQGQEISREYQFSDFVGAMAFVNHVADQAEKMDHHPDILVRYNKVKLTLSTHSAGGLTDLDFTLAQRIDWTPA